jgi:hypothetical protein
MSSATPAVARLPCRRSIRCRTRRASTSWAHVLLGHTAEGEQNDGELTPRNLRECEAEAVAMLCCAALGLPGVEFSRGYIQSWWGASNPIPERSAQRILKAADQILKAGTSATTDGKVVA